MARGIRAVRPAHQARHPPRTGTPARSIHALAIKVVVLMAAVVVNPVRFGALLTGALPVVHAPPQRRT
jgi:hypothetical protein